MHTNRDIVLTTVNHNFNLFPHLRLIAISVKKYMLRTEVKALHKITLMYSLLPQVLVFEDAPNGVEAGKAAGICRL